jgi:hypothetical protein
MRNISTTVRGHYDDDRYMWSIVIRRFCDTVGMRDDQPVMLLPFPYASFATLMSNGLSGGAVAVFFVEKSE